MTYLESILVETSEDNPLMKQKQVIRNNPIV